MEGEFSIWSLLVPLVRLFEPVGEQWVSSIGSDQPPAFGVESIYTNPTPIVSTILEEVRTGWSFETVLEIWGPIFLLSMFASIIVSIVVTYCCIRIWQIRRVERLSMRAAARPIAGGDLPRVQLRWQRIMEQAHSDDPQKWRIAILEADLLLNELLDVLGYKGETMSDKMKQVEVAQFNTIDFAWEAHQIRNRLTNAGYEIDAREAKRVIRMYERVFREFRYV